MFGALKFQVLSHIVVFTETQCHAIHYVSSLKPFKLPKVTIVKAYESADGSSLIPWLLVVNSVPDTEVSQAKNPTKLAS